MDTPCSKILTLQNFVAPESWCSGKGSAPKIQKNENLTLIILGSVQVSVQMEQDKPENVISTAASSEKDASFVLELEPGTEVEKNENSGK